MNNAQTFQRGPFVPTTAAKRFDQSWNIAIKTMGTKQAFPLQALNVSRSGLLVQADGKNNGVPFRDRTLVELTIEPDGQHLRTRVHAMGKVVRFFSPNGIEREQIGIQLIEVEEQEMWDGMLTRLESESTAASASVS